MLATTLTAMTPLQMVLFGKDQVSVRAQIIVLFFKVYLLMESRFYAFHIAKVYNGYVNVTN